MNQVTITVVVVVVHHSSVDLNSQVGQIITSRINTKDTFLQVLVAVVNTLITLVALKELEVSVSFIAINNIL